MKFKNWQLALALGTVLLFAGKAKAQTVLLSDTFTFAGGSYACQNITSWDGNSAAFPEDMGGICMNQGDPYGGYGSYLDVPFQLGYLNNGYLAACNPITWAAKVFTLGDGTHNGDTFNVAGVTSCPYYTGEYGGASDNEYVGFSVVASYVVVSHRSCNRGRCINYLTNTLQGGTGTVTETQN